MTVSTIRNPRLSLTVTAHAERRIRTSARGMQKVLSLLSRGSRVVCSRTAFAVLYCKRNGYAINPVTMAEGVQVYDSLVAM